MSTELFSRIFLTAIRMSLVPDIGALDVLSTLFLLLTLIACLFLFYFIWQTVQERLFERREKVAETKLSEILENSNELVFLLNSRFQIIFISRAVTSNLGYELKDIKEFSIETIQYDDTWNLSGKLTEVASSAKGTALPCRMKLKDVHGRYSIYQATIKNALKTPGIHGIIINAYNITEFENMKKMEVIASRRFTEMVQYSPDLVIILNHKLKITYISPSVEEAIGVHFNEGNIKFTDFIYPDDTFQVLRKLFEIRNTDTGNRQFTFRAKGKTGQWIYLEANSNNQLANKSINGIILNLRDISERLEIQNKLIENEAHQRAIIQSSFDAIWSLDTELRLTLYNKQFEDEIKLIYNIDVEPGMRMPTEFEDTIVTLPWEETYKIALRGMPLAEHQIIRKKNIYRHFEILINPIRNDKNKVIGIVCFARDITQSKQAEAHLLQAKNAAEESARIKSEFLANMSHEIRTPLNGIIVLTELFSRSMLNEEQKENIRLIKESADSLMMIINDILDFSKIEAGKLHLENIPFNMEEVIQKAIGVVVAKLKEKQLALTVDYADTRIPKYLMGDPGRIHQIIVNLLSNAVKFTHAGGISIQAEVVRQENAQHVIQITVTDSGIGIPEEKLATIFESFTQADGSTTRRFGGTGLGLSITKKIIDMYKGSIHLESRQNVGTKITVELPLEKATMEAIAGTGIPAIEKQKTDRPMKILVADDSLINQKVMQQIFQDLKHPVRMVNNGAEVLEEIEKQSYDMVILDLYMPEMDGVETARALRARQISIPLIGLTASHNNEDKEACLKAGMNEVIYKPFTTQEIENTLRKYLG